MSRTDLVSGLFQIIFLENTDFRHSLYFSDENKCQIVREITDLLFLPFELELH